MIPRNNFPLIFKYSPKWKINTVFVSIPRKMVKLRCYKEKVILTNVVHRNYVVALSLAQSSCTIKAHLGEPYIGLQVVQARFHLAQSQWGEQASMHNSCVRVCLKKHNWMFLVSTSDNSSQLPDLFLRPQSPHTVQNQHTCFM